MEKERQPGLVHLTRIAVFILFSTSARLSQFYVKINFGEELVWVVKGCQMSAFMSCFE